jgi:hypothetical protein
VANAGGEVIGQGIAGYGIPPNTTIVNVAGTTLTISNEVQIPDPNRPSITLPPGTTSVSNVPCSIWIWTPQ